MKSRQSTWSGSAASMESPPPSLKSSPLDTLGRSNVTAMPSVSKAATIPSASSALTIPQRQMRESVSSIPGAVSPNVWGVDPSGRMTSHAWEYGSTVLA